MIAHMESLSLCRSQDDMVVVSWTKLLACLIVTSDSEFLERVVTAATTNTVWQKEFTRVMEGNPPNDVSYEHGSFYYQACLWISECSNPDLKFEICEDEHHSKIAGDMGMDRRVEIIRRNILWPQMNSFIEDYIRSCKSSQCNKASRHARY